MERISKYRTELMGFAALSVYVFHCVPQIFTGRELLDTTALWFLKYGTFFGVDIFFLLSGFGLSYAFSRHKITNWRKYLSYLKKRLVRIYLVYAPVLVITMLVEKRSFQYMISRLFLFAHFKYSFYEYLWFIPAIILIYIAAPFWWAVYDAAGRTGVAGEDNELLRKKSITIAVVALTILILFTGTGWIREDLYSMLIRIPDFLIGIYLGELSRRQKKMTPAVLLASCVAVLIGAAGMMIQDQPGVFHGWTIPEVIPAMDTLYAVPIGIGTTILLSWIFSLIAPEDKEKGIGRILLMPFTFLGTISLEFYCVQEWVWSIMAGTSLPGKTWLNLLACILFAYGIHRIGQIVLTKEVKMKN